MVTMLLASWIRRRVFRSWKKLFQSSFGREGDGELAAEPDVEAVVAFRRPANWHWRGVGCFRGAIWKVILVEIWRDGTRVVVQGFRTRDMSGEDDDEYGQFAPRAKAV
ncbi:hypothetical protein ONZ43_g1524 [Nemania bipapillata]|uniref:Uncharacterized protein n=1 Tax=Nemania bipapillata TaxID=110536 RepID=A0ACC2J442_9PEZI|nr:hypothetical protein ONZ43_g1524 [Nemania bipapillata]